MENFFARILRLNETDTQVAQIKQDTLTKLDETASVVKKAGDLQAKVLKKTTTYYIGKGLGVVK